MGEHALTASTAELIEQAQSAAPSQDALRLLDAALVLAHITREAVARECSITQGNVIAWAFARGKSRRAAQVRRTVIAALEKRERGRRTN